MDDNESAVQSGDEEFWSRFTQLEARHQKVQGEHEVARRDLDTAKREQVDDLMRVWRAYCRVIEQLEQTAGALEKLGMDGPGLGVQPCEGQGAAPSPVAPASSTRS